MKMDGIIDRFVARLSLEGTYFERILSAPWIESFEERLPEKLPRSFASLVKRYRFPSFVFGGVNFFSNLGTGGDEELVRAVFRDPCLAGTLSSCFIQIGRPDTGSYDLVCFDARHRRGGEYPMVVLDHEQLLQHNKVRLIKVVAQTFQNSRGRPTSAKIRLCDRRSFRGGYSFVSWAREDRHDRGTAIAES